MHISRFFFKFSDMINHPLRNYKRYPKVTTLKNIIYDTKYDSPLNMLDLYFRLDAKGKLPVMFNVHGGGFVRGGRKYRSGFARKYADQGWFVVNIGYRLAPAAPFPAATEDAINALNFVNGLSEQHNLDLSKIVITGDSAGAYYAAHLISSITNDKLRESLHLPEYEGVMPRALLSFCAPFDLLKCFSKPAPLGISRDVTNCVFNTIFEKDDDFYENFPFENWQVNILENVSANWPETFIVEAVNDSFCGSQAKAMVEVLDKFEVKNHLYLANHKGDNHCTHLLPFMPGNKRLYAEVDKFLHSIKNEK